MLPLARMIHASPDNTLMCINGMFFGGVMVEMVFSNFLTACEELLFGLFVATSPPRRPIVLADFSTNR